MVCTNNTNYKILYICAYFLSKQGTHTLVLREGQSVPALLRYLKDEVRSEEGEADGGKPEGEFFELE